MTDPQPAHPSDETDASDATEVIPSVTSGEGIARTRELPVVEDEPTVVTPPPTPAPPPAAPAPPPPAPAPPPPAPAPPPPAPAPPPRPPRRRDARADRRRGPRRVLVLAGVAAVVVLAAVAGLVALRGGDSNTSAPASGPAASVTIPATVTSVDPSGGSGLRRDGSAWRTQTYTSADFGNLKDGVGLLLDLGDARNVTSVTVNVAGGPIAVELRAGDSAANAASGYQRVAADPAASGATTLAANGGGKHRYWLVWVTRLAPAGGGYRAVLQDPAVHGPRR